VITPLGPYSEARSLGVSASLARSPTNKQTPQLTADRWASLAALGAAGALPQTPRRLVPPNAPLPACLPAPRWGGEAIGRQGSPPSRPLASPHRLSRTLPQRDSPSRPSPAGAAPSTRVPVAAALTARLALQWPGPEPGGARRASQEATLTHPRTRHYAPSRRLLVARRRGPRGEGSRRTTYHVQAPHGVARNQPTQ